MIPSCRLLVPLLAAVAATSIPVIAAPAPLLSASTSGLLTQTLQPFVDNHVSAGFVAIVADKSKVLDFEGVGYSSLAKKTPMQGNTLFWIASMSKSFTATALMMLVDEGKVKIDDPVEKYLPEFKGQMVADELDPKHTLQPATHPITIKEILSHTSGLTRPDSLTRAQYAAQDGDSLQREVADHAAQPLVRQPGTKYEYNNIGIDTAGRIIEVVSGMPYGDFMRKRIFDPLGMKDTTFWPTLEQGARLARTVGPNADKTGLQERDIYTANKTGIDGLAKRELGSDQIVPPALLSEGAQSPIFVYKLHYAMPAGGIYSTAPDLARFCQMLLNGGVFEGKRYVSENAIKQMTSPQTGNLYPNHSSAYGLGWELKISPMGLPSEGTFAHTGALRTRMWVDPKRQLVMVLLMAHMNLASKDQEAIYGGFLKAAEENYGK